MVGSDLFAPRDNFRKKYTILRCDERMPCCLFYKTRQELEVFVEIFNAIVASVGLGITTSIIWAAIVLIYNWRRNRQVEIGIRKSIEPTGMSFSIDGTVGMEIENNTFVPVVIRSVALICGEECNNTINFGMSQYSSPRGTEANGRGWVELPPMTKATWSFPFKPDESGWADRFRPVKEIRVTVEYTTLFGTTKIIEIGPAKHFLPSDFNHCFDGKHYEDMVEARAKVAARQRGGAGVFGSPATKS